LNVSGVVVVGSINLDRTVRVERLPAVGETLRAISETFGGGGKGANAAVASALTGSPTSLVGCVGSDDAARIALADLIELGVDTAGVWVTSAPTGSATVFVDSDGQNCIVVVGGANDELTPEHVAQAVGAVADTRVVLTNLEIPDPAVLAAAEAAAGRDAIFILNPAPARFLSDELLDLKPILTPNQDEVARLSGVDAKLGAMQLCERTSAPVIVTMGKQGALLAHQGRLQKIPAPAVVPVDTTGAGDVFNGSLAGNLARGMDFVASARIAVEQASRSTCYPGARARGSR
jgi:ribokinase